MAVELPAETERLYAVPPEEFVKERDALARELRGAGRGDQADRVRQLRRPSVALWAVNQLARRRELDLRRLLRAGERLRGGERRAADDIAAEIDRLVRAARTVVEDSDRRASDDALQRVASTLRAAVADETHARALAEGRLTEEVAPAGFESMAALVGAPAPTGDGERRPARATAASRRRDRARVRAAQEALSEARTQARELRRAADEAERQAGRARAAAERAEADVERAERRLAELRGS
jgi:hypothetical protein